VRARSTQTHPPPTHTPRLGQLARLVGLATNALHLAARRLNLVAQGAHRVGLAVRRRTPPSAIDLELRDRVARLAQLGLQAVTVDAAAATAAHIAARRRELHLQACDLAAQCLDRGRRDGLIHDGTRADHLGVGGKLERRERLKVRVERGREVCND
jgi:hypothetical protein